MANQISESAIEYAKFLRLINNELAETFLRMLNVLVSELKGDVRALTITTLAGIDTPVVFVEYIVNGHILTASVHPRLLNICKVPSTYKGKRTIIVDRFTDKELAEHLTCLLPVSVPPLS